MSNGIITPPIVTFWTRQFFREATAYQVVFDLVFGIALPVICLIADPFVFRTTFGSPLLGNYALLAYTFIGLQVSSLCVWLLFRRLPALFTGILAAGATFSLCLGVVLFPFSLIGLMVAIGILGFSPFATSFVYWRNSIRARSEARRVGGKTWVLTTVCGFLMALAVPLTAQVYVQREKERAVELALSSEPAERAEGIRKLRRVAPLTDLDRLVYAYEEERDEARRQQIRDVYKELTSEEIGHRLAVLRD
jgi:hypothetical protein